MGKTDRENEEERETEKEKDRENDKSDRDKTELLKLPKNRRFLRPEN